jgi:hypothetical protein
VRRKVRHGSGHMQRPTRFRLHWPRHNDNIITTGVRRAMVGSTLPGIDTKPLSD